MTGDDWVLLPTRFYRRSRESVDLFGDQWHQVVRSGMVTGRDEEGEIKANK
jgi:hypothetical protein